MGNLFIKDLKEYKGETTPVMTYVKDASRYISKVKNISYEEALKLVKLAIRDSDTRNPIVTFNNRSENGDMDIETTTLSNYIEDSVKKNYIVVPSLTAYDHPDRNKSLHAEFLQENISSRNADKRKAFEYKQDGNMVLHGRYNTLQKSKKIANNSLSGAYASVSTVLYNPSAHYSLTSTTRTATSIANAITESMVAGNKHFREPETVINYLVYVTNNVDIDLIAHIVSKYNLHKPTVDEVFNTILRSTNLYWNNVEYEAIITRYLSKLTGYELAAILYTNDIYHMRVYNDNVLRDFFGELSSRMTNTINDPLKVLEESEEFILNLVHHICSSDIKGKKIKYEDMVGTELLNILGATALNINLVLYKYSDLLHAFFRSNIMPVSVAYLKDMLRRVTVLSDTDSTCATYQEWVEWFLGDNVFNDVATAVSASVMTVVTQVLEHKLRQYTSNMNVPDDLKHKISYKGEFYWHTMTPTSVAKHYFAAVAIQEGNVFAKDDLELKGVNLIASNAPMFVQEITKNVIISINETLLRNEKISIRKYLIIVADLERRIIKELHAGNIGVLKISKIKEASGYKLGPDKSPYLNHILWKDVFSKHYGHIDEPPYTAVKIPTLLKTKRLLNNWIDKLEEGDIKRGIKEYCKTYNKEYIGTFNLPLILIGEHGIPDILLDTIDVNRIVFDSLGALYMVLESALGFYRKENMKIMDMGY